MGERSRVVLKMSGEALATSASDETIDAAAVEQLAGEIAQARLELDIELAGFVARSPEHPEAASVGNGSDHIPAMAERADREFHAQHVGDPCPHFRNARSY